VLDIPSENLYLHFDAAVDFIKTGIARGGVLVHCFAGVSRSSSCVIAYLMREHEMTYIDALQFVRKARPVVCPNFGFEKQLQEYEAELLRKKQSYKTSPMVSKGKSMPQ